MFDSDDHSQQDNRSLAVIRHYELMKLAWEPGSHCFCWMAVDVNFCDELKFERQAEEKPVIYRGDDSDLEEFGHHLPDDEAKMCET